jgi:hypothetical protein
MSASGTSAARHQRVMFVTVGRTLEARIDALLGQHGIDQEFLVRVLDDERCIADLLDLVTHVSALFP